MRGIVNPALTELKASVVNLENSPFTTLETTAQFTGGISVNGSSYTHYLTQPAQQGDIIMVSGAITPSTKHIGQTADILLVGAVQGVSGSKEITAPDDCDLQKGTWVWHMNTKRNIVIAQKVRRHKPKQQKSVRLEKRVNAMKAMVIPFARLMFLAIRV
ncbi:MAG: hypothetical protein ABL903_05085 [Methylococcales bacterium]